MGFVDDIIAAVGVIIMAMVGYLCRMFRNTSKSVTDLQEGYKLLEARQQSTDKLVDTKLKNITTLLDNHLSHHQLALEPKVDEMIKLANKMDGKLDVIIGTSTDVS